MNPILTTPSWSQYGLLGLMVCAIVTLLFIIIKWTLATTRDILNTAREERELSNKERECWMKAFNAHTEQAKLFHESVKDAHDYQRQEHKEMIEILGRINGYKK